MPDNKKIAFHWSSGKDSALALYYLLQDENYQVDHLVTTTSEEYDRVTMHGTRVELLEKQFESIGIPSSLIRLPSDPSMETYENKMTEKLAELKSKAILLSAFGDIFLEDLKKYREEQFQKQNISCVFPIWKKDTKELILDFIALGFKAVIVSANSDLGEAFMGREIDETFVNDLPSGIDPCGENGEFHTFCYDGPIFKNPIPFSLGEKTKRSYPNPTGDGTVDFWFQDLIPK